MNGCYPPLKRGNRMNAWSKYWLQRGILLLRKIIVLWNPPLRIDFYATMQHIPPFLKGDDNQSFNRIRVKFTFGERCVHTVALKRGNNTISWWKFVCKGDFHREWQPFIYLLKIRTILNQLNFISSITRTKTSHQPIRFTPKYKCNAIRMFRKEMYSDPKAFINLKTFDNPPG